jgi:glyoxalase family protein
MAHQILGLHHVTATVDAAQPDLDFFASALGLRLVKKTVNFDNHSVYHFYYGTEIGAPGTIWTTFPYGGLGVPVGRHGAGQIRTTAFSVPAGSLGFWAQRLARLGCDVRPEAARFGDDVLEVRDPSGLVIDLIETARDDRAPWTGGGIDAAHAIRGLHGVTLIESSSDRTVGVMTTLLNFAVVAEAGDRIRLATGGDRPGAYMDLLVDPSAAAGRNGLGTVHHVAMAIGEDEEQLRLREDLVRFGLHVTPVMDRQYFHSIYFREPGGVLFEVATMKPGFLIDEPRDALGRGLKLPPWEERNRPAIERSLTPVVVPAADAERRNES